MCVCVCVCNSDMFSDLSANTPDVVGSVERCLFWR